VIHKLLLFFIMYS